MSWQFKGMAKIIGYAIKCITCGRWGAKETHNLNKARFHCKYCNALFNLKGSNNHLIAQVRGPYQTSLMPGIIGKLNGGNHEIQS